MRPRLNPSQLQGPHFQMRSPLVRRVRTLHRHLGTRLGDTARPGTAAAGQRSWAGPRIGRLRAAGRDRDQRVSGRLGRGPQNPPRPLHPTRPYCVCELPLQLPPGKCAAEPSALLVVTAQVRPRWGRSPPPGTSAAATAIQALAGAQVSQGCPLRTHGHIPSSAGTEALHSSRAAEGRRAGGGGGCCGQSRRVQPDLGQRRPCRPESPPCSAPPGRGPSWGAHSRRQDRGTAAA